MKFGIGILQIYWLGVAEVTMTGHFHCSETFFHDPSPYRTKALHTSQKTSFEEFKKGEHV